MADEAPDFLEEWYTQTLLELREQSLADENWPRAAEELLRQVPTGLATPARRMLAEIDVIDRLLGGVWVTGAEGQPVIEVDASVADLIEAHPELLLEDSDAELDQRQRTAGSDAARQHLAAVRQVLAVCRAQGVVSPLRRQGSGYSTEPEELGGRGGSFPWH